MNTETNENVATSYQPLAARMRPRSVNEFIGQEHLLGIGKPLRRAIENKILHSMILWGPPGSGKTTLAKLLAASVHAHVETISAVLAGVKDIREVVARAKEIQKTKNQPTILLSMKFTALINLSKMHFYHLLKMVS